MCSFHMGGSGGGLMVSELVSGSYRQVLSPGQGHCVVFMGRTLNSHSATLHLVVQMGTGIFNAGGEQPCNAQASHPGGVPSCSLIM